MTDLISIFNTIEDCCREGHCLLHLNYFLLSPFISASYEYSYLKFQSKKKNRVFSLSPDSGYSNLQNLLHTGSYSCILYFGIVTPYKMNYKTAKYYITHFNSAYS